MFDEPSKNITINTKLHVLIHFLSPRKKVLDHIIEIKIKVSYKIKDEDLF